MLPFSRIMAWSEYNCANKRSGISLLANIGTTLVLHPHANSDVALFLCRIVACQLDHPSASIVTRSIR